MHTAQTKLQLSVRKNQRRRHKQDHSRLISTSSNVLATVVDWYFWRVSPVNFAGAINATLAGLAIGFLCVPSRKAECVITVPFAIRRLRHASSNRMERNERPAAGEPVDARVKDNDNSKTRNTCVL
jgi:hypothetical protein